MTLDTQMTLALLQELLLAQRANDAEGFKGWLALGLEELGRQVVIELMQGWISPLLTEVEQDRLWGGGAHTHVASINEKQSITLFKQSIYIFRNLLRFDER